MKSAKFKDSPLGPIPQDWEVKRLGEIAPLQRGFDLPTKELQEGPFPVVYSNGICNYHVEAMCDAPGLVTGRSGTIGHFTFIESGRYWPHNTALWVTSFKGNDPLYIKYLYETLHFENFATGSGVPTLNRNAIHEYEVALPSKIEEQQRIAEALGEVDKLIESLDEQIEKKRLIAKGVAHDLLSAKKRLPGFKGEWKSVRLGELSEIVTGGTPSTEVPAFWGGDIRWMNSGDVHLKRIHDVDGRITQLGYASSNARLIPIGSVVIALAGQGKTRGTAAITECELCTNQSIGAILPSEKHDSECLYYVLAMQYEKLRAASSGDGTRGGLSKKILEEYIVKLPVDIAEQQAIADLLSEQDAAIAALEEKREKYARIKDGMMRDMLTGKVRI